MKTSEIKEAIERIRQNVQGQLALVQNAEDAINLGRDENHVAEALSAMTLDAQRVIDLANAVLAKVWR